ncbi:hypothetical protein FRB90_006899 [Tulasnella sp. 427]|nr:hypothetical protein FRB90_006899 [Tulasnella sp. 427]
MMDTGSSAAKRKRDESSMPGVPATSAQAKWITPSFGSPSPEKKKPKSMMKISATSAPAFRIKDVPTTPKPKVQAPTSPTATGTKFPAFKSEEHDSAFGIKDEMDELLVGLNVSPEKPDRKGKGKRFVRNGLAERASHLLTRAQNDFSLWSHDLASSLSVAQDIRTYTTGAPRQRKPVKPVSPDLRLLVTETLTTFHTKEFKPSSRMIVPPAYCLARCKIKDTDVGDLLVLFSFAGSGGHGFAVPSIASPRGLEAGAEVLIWKPWIDIDLDHRISSALANEEDVKPIQSHPNPQTHNEGDDASMEDIDTVPSTPTNEEDRKMIKAKMISILEEKGETSARRRAMLCSRFMVKR